MKLEFETLAEIVADPTLDDNDLVKCTDDSSFSYTVGELRAASNAVTASVEQLRAASTAAQHQYAAPDPYAAHLAKLRAAEATPESEFENKWKAMRAAEFAQTRAALDAEEPKPRLTDLVTKLQQ